MDSRKPEVPVLQSLFSFLRFDNRDKIEDQNFWFQDSRMERMYNETLDHWFINIHWNSLISKNRHNFGDFVNQWSLGATKRTQILFLLVDKNLLQFYVELNIRKCSKILVTLVSYCKLENNLFLIYLAYKLCDDTCYGNLLEVTVVRVELLCSSRADLTKITQT